MDQVSICIPTYNGAVYLRECINSAQQQTHADCEILVVDDCSSDDTLAIAQAMATSDARIRVLRNDSNQGLVGNWNRCIALARGTWIKFLFQDDLLHADCVAQMLAAADARQARFVVCDRDFLFDDTIDAYWHAFYARNRAKVRDFLVPDGGTTPARYAAKILQHSNFNFVGEPTTVLLHRALFERYGLFDKRLAQLCDVEYWNRVASHEGLVFVDQPLASFRVHAAATSTLNRLSKAFVSGGLDALTLVDLMLEQPVYAAMRQQWQQQGLLAQAQAERLRRAHQVRQFVRQHSGQASDQHEAGAQIAALYSSFLQRHPSCIVSDRAHGLWLARQLPHQAKARLDAWLGAFRAPR
jgi:GT2 family glycosyltransferase